MRIESATLAFSLSILMASATFGQSVSPTQPLQGPDSVLNQLRSDQLDSSDLLNVDSFQDWDSWKERLNQESGLDFGVDYNALGFAATKSIGENGSASGAARFYGTWELVERGSPNNGQLVWKLESRHSYSKVPPTSFGSEIGYTGLLNSVFSDQKWRATHLYWQQNFAEGRSTSFAGFLDITDYVDVYAMASPWTGFSNLAFQTGSGTIGGLPDGALGMMLGGFLTDNLYAVASAVDINGDPTQVFDGFNSLFSHFETIQTLDIGWTEGRDRLFLDNMHVTFWHIDESRLGLQPEGWGVHLSLSRVIKDSWLVFLRGGWSEDGGSLYEASVSTGFGFQSQPGDDLTGLGLNWSRPNPTTFGEVLDDQGTVELFHRMEITEELQVTPSIQVLVNPALVRQQETVAVFGLRVRYVF